MSIHQKAKWDSLASNWVDTGPPASPSAEDVWNYEQLLTETLPRDSSESVILLGCTPSLRDMLARIIRNGNSEVVCVDFSTKMYEQTTRATKFRNPNERFVLADWCDFDIGKSLYSAILGDKVIDNIMPPQWPDLFERVHYHLRPGGSFIVHLALADERFRTVTFTKALEKWAALRLQAKLPIEHVVAGLWEDVLTASAFKDGNYYNTVKTGRFADEVEAISRKHESLELNQKEIFNEFLRVFWPSRDDEWSSYQYEEILEAMSQYFVHDKTVYSTDYDVAVVQPIIRMKAK